MILPEASEGGAFIIKDSGALLTWLIYAGTLITRSMGGILPERDSDLTGIRNVLDLGCGPGDWVLDMAFEHPEVEACGVDISRPIIDYAYARAASQKLTNASFEVMDITEPLSFPDQSFDLVNVRLLFSSLKPQQWPPLLQECKRLLRSGGIMRVTELERSLTNSPATERYWDIYSHALSITGRSFSVNGKSVGILPHLGRLLHEAGFEQIQNRIYAPDMSAWSPDFETWRQHFLVIWQLLEPFLIESGVTTKEESEQLRRQANAEMWAEDYCGLHIFFTAWGEKP